MDCGCNFRESSAECSDCRDRFSWVDGVSDVPDFWASGEPGLGEACVHLLQQKGEEWAASPCTDQLGFICKAGKSTKADPAQIVFFWERSKEITGPFHSSIFN